jgi:hypothetical protein
MDWALVLIELIAGVWSFSSEGEIAIRRAVGNAADCKSARLSGILRPSIIRR